MIFNRFSLKIGAVIRPSPISGIKGTPCLCVPNMTKSLSWHSNGVLAGSLTVKQSSDFSVSPGCFYNKYRLQLKGVVLLAFFRIVLSNLRIFLYDF